MSFNLEDIKNYVEYEERSGKQHNSSYCDEALFEYMRIASHYRAMRNVVSSLIKQKSDPEVWNWVSLKGGFWKSSA